MTRREILGCFSAVWIVLGILVGCGGSTIARAHTAIEYTSSSSILIKPRVTEEGVSWAALDASARLASYRELVNQDGFEHEVLAASGIQDGAVHASSAANSLVLTLVATSHTLGQAQRLAHAATQRFLRVQHAIEDSAVSPGLRVDALALNDAVLAHEVQRFRTAWVLGSGAAGGLVVGLIASLLALGLTSPRTRLRRPSVVIGSLLGVGVGAAALGYLSVTSPEAAVIVGGVAVLAVIGVAMTASASVAWIALCAASFANGIGLNAGGFHLRLEFFVVPVFVLTMILRDRLPVMRQAPLAYRLIVIPGLVLWIALTFLSSVFGAPSPAGSLVIVVQLVIATMVLVPVSQANLDLAFCLRAGTWTLGVISIVGFGYMVVGHLDRNVGLAFEPNVMGALSAGWLCLVWYFVGTGRVRGLVTPTLVGWYGVIAIAGIVTLTRATWIVLALLVLAMVLHGLRSRPGALVILVVLGVGCGLFVLLTLKTGASASEALYRLKHLVDFGSGTGAYRAGLWEDALHDIDGRGASFLWGTGAGSFSQFHPIDPTMQGPAYLSSFWLATLYDTGVVGLLVVCAFLVGVVAAIRHRWEAMPLVIGLAISTSITSIAWFSFSWLFLGLVLNDSLRQRIDSVALPVSPQRAADRSLAMEVVS